MGMEHPTALFLLGIRGVHGVAVSAEEGKVSILVCMTFVYLQLYSAMSTTLFPEVL